MNTQEANFAQLYPSTNNASLEAQITKRFVDDNCMLGAEQDYKTYWNGLTEQQREDSEVDIIDSVKALLSTTQIEDRRVSHEALGITFHTEQAIYKRRKEPAK